MEITEVRVKLVSVKNDKLRAFCSITVDNDFVIRDLKIIEGAKGAFVAMPSRKLTDRCSRCGGKNHYRARFCNDCGARLGGDRSGKYDSGNQKRHTDIAHPINSKCREAIQKKVLEVYQEEVERSEEPGYRPMEYEVFDEEALADEINEEIQGDFLPPSGLQEQEPSASGREPKYFERGSRGQGQITAATSESGVPGRERPRRDHDGERRDRSEHGRGRFRRGGRRSRNGRSDQRRGNGGGQRHNGRSRETLQETEAKQETVNLGIPEGDRQNFLPEKPEAPAARQGETVSQQNPASPNLVGPREEAEAEPEDNFGAGLFT